MINGDQLRAARALLRLTVKQTAELAGIDKGTVVRIESGAEAYRLTLNRLQEVLEGEGLVFLDEVDGVAGPGVRFRFGADKQRRSAEKFEGKSGRKVRDDKDAVGIAEHVKRNAAQFAEFSEHSRSVVRKMIYGDDDELFGIDAR